MSVTSNIHQIAIHEVTARTATPDEESPSGLKNSKTSKNEIGPRRAANFFIDILVQYTNYAISSMEIILLLTDLKKVGLGDIQILK